MSTQPSGDVDQHATNAPAAIAIDLGTGGPKVGVVTFDGSIIWQGRRPVASKRIGAWGATQDPNDWWHAIVEMIGEALASPEVKADKLVAVSITGQYASTVPVDGAGKPVGDCLLWMDTRGRSYARKRFGGRAAGYDPRIAATWIRRSGGAPSLSGADPIGHRLFLQAEHREIIEEARWLMEPIDHLAMRFTGVAAASPASMATAWLIDTRRPNQRHYDVELVQRSGIYARQLPPLVPSASVTGRVIPQVADFLGLPQGLNVIAALPDLHTGALGSGAVGRNEAHLAISTSSWVSAPVHAKKTDILHQIATVPGLRSNDYLVINNHEVGGLALDWFCGAVLGLDDSTDAFNTATELAESAQPGAGNVLFTPWLNGERSPIEDSRARGGFHNLSLRTSRSELARSVFEGVALNSRWLSEAVERFTGTRFGSIRVIGGGAQSSLWCQIHADVLDRTIERPHDPRSANLRGAALSAAIALGHIRLDNVADLIGPVDRFEPNAANRRVYDALFEQFPKRYRADKAMFHALNQD